MLNKRKSLPIFLLILAIFFVGFAFYFYPTIKTDKEGMIVNILGLGVAGAGHPGANLTDTIILAHINIKSSTVTLVSIPRDLWIEELENKINVAYQDGGLSHAKTTVSQILGQPIHYALKIDFSGFVKAVDILGGLDISIEQGFDDYNYPISLGENDTCGKSEEELKKIEASVSASQKLIPFSEIFPCRVEHIQFTQGTEHMDGATALKFARSRQAEGSEGTDFARSKRQQKVILAFRDKLLSPGVLLNPFKLVQLTQALGKSIDTDIKTSEYDDFVSLAQKIQGAKVKNIVLDDNLFINPPVSQYGAWVLIPQTGDFKEIQEYISCQLTKDDCVIDKQ